MPWCLGLSSNEVEIKHTSQVIYARLADSSKAYLKYSVEGGVMLLVETYVPPQHRGKGLARRLVEYAVKLAKENNWLIKPICSYAIYYFMKNPEERAILVREYRDLNDDEWTRLYNEARAREQAKS